MVPVSVVIVPFCTTRLVDVTVPANKLEIAPFNAFTVVPEAVLNASTPVDVTFPATNAPMVAEFTFKTLPDAVTKPNHPVDVTLVNTAAAGVVAPIVVPLIVPPVTVTEGETKPAAFTAKAFTVVPDAVTKPNTPVDVTFVKIPVEAVVFPIGVPLIDPPVIPTFPEEKFATVPFIANKLVVVV